MQRNTFRRNNYGNRNFEKAVMGRRRGDMAGGVIEVEVLRRLSWEGYGSRHFEKIVMGREPWGYNRRGYRNFEKVTIGRRPWEYGRRG